MVLTTFSWPCRRGGEEEARVFFGHVLGMQEEMKPEPTSVQSHGQDTRATSSRFQMHAIELLFVFFALSAV